MAQIRSVKTETRLADWIRRLSDSKGKATRAMDLYCGDHWHVLRTLAENQTEPPKFKLWVASAGWGLISSEDKITSYGATFSHLESDSVIHPRVALRDARMWWNGLVQSNFQGKKTPSSFTALAKRNPESPMLVALPVGYLAAVRDDLLAARSLLEIPELLVVVSGGTKREVELSRNLIPCDSRLQPLLGGSLTSLNARTARFILENYNSRTLRANRVFQDFENLILQSEKRSLPKRNAMTDEEVSDFISKQLSIAHSKQSHSSLLRAFRDLGKACEQRRFRRIYNDAIQSRNQK
jgi:hypothetical protein